MKTLYIDAFIGISGNMYIGAMIDAGYKVEPFIRGLEAIGVGKEEILLKRVEKAGIAATYFNVVGEEHKLESHDDHAHDHHDQDHTHDHEHHGGHAHHHRGLKEVYALIEASGFDEEVKNLAKAIYRPLAEAEAKVHGKDVDTVHFHEVGELDSIIDVLGAAYFTVTAEVEKIYCGAINPGGGTVHCAHGDYPVPAPATAYLLAAMDIPMGGSPADVELTTPTGAAIVKGIDARYMPRPKGRVRKVSYGAGTRELPTPNVLRLFFLETEEETAPVWFSCNLDDMTGEALGFCMERLFEAGALDVSFTPIMMKKNRPAHRLDVLTVEEKCEAIKKVLFTHTTTLGIKKIPVEKIELPRHMEKATTELGTVRTKIARFGEAEKASPEYEDLREIALNRALPLEEVRRAWERR